MLEISGLSAKYGAVVALADVTLSVERGQIVSLLGSNGAGKSTLLGCVTNSVPCRMTGSIKLEGAEISGLPTDAIIARGLVLVPEGRQLFAELTVENLRMGAYSFDRGRMALRPGAGLQTVPVAGRAPAPGSGHALRRQQQMVAIARALWRGPASCCSTSRHGARANAGERGIQFDPGQPPEVTVLLVEQSTQQARIASQTMSWKRAGDDMTGPAGSHEGSASSRHIWVKRDHMIERSGLKDFEGRCFNAGGRRRGDVAGRARSAEPG
jgi:branched-chain amino acid transport system ATP-binding protein